MYENAYPKFQDILLNSVFPELKQKETRQKRKRKITDYKNNQELEFWVVCKSVYPYGVYFTPLLYFSNSKLRGKGLFPFSFHFLIILFSLKLAYHLFLLSILSLWRILPIYFTLSTANIRKYRLAWPHRWAPCLLKSKILFVICMHVLRKFWYTPRMSYVIRRILWVT